MYKLITKLPANNIPGKGELLYYYDSDSDTVRTILVGDGKTEAKNLPSLYNIYDRITKIENTIELLSNEIIKLKEEL